MSPPGIKVHKIASPESMLLDLISILSVPSFFFDPKLKLSFKAVDALLAFVPVESFFDLHLLPFDGLEFDQLDKKLGEQLRGLRSTFSSRQVAADERHDSVNEIFYEMLMRVVFALYYFSLFPNFGHSSLDIRGANDIPWVVFLAPKYYAKRTF